MVVGSRPRHARTGPGRWLLPGVLVAMVAVALVVAWSTLQNQSEPAAAGPPTTVVTTPTASIGDGSDAVTPSSTVPSTSKPSTSKPSSTASPSTSTAPAPSATSTASSSASPSRSASPTASPSPTRAARSYRVVVLNATSTTGRAARTASNLRGAGWTVSRIGNWSQRPPSTTVYYPDGAQAAAQVLAADLGVARVRPAYAALPSGRLVVVLG